MAQEAQDILKSLRRIGARGATVLLRYRIESNAEHWAGMRYAVATGRAVRDPTSDLRGALSPVVETHFAAVADPAEITLMSCAMAQRFCHLSVRRVDSIGGDVGRLLGVWRR
jgi:hypothetical protein